VEDILLVTIILDIIQGIAELPRAEKYEGIMKQKVREHKGGDKYLVYRGLFHSIKDVDNTENKHHSPELQVEITNGECHSSQL
jgi:hypothetical protein